MTTPAAAAPVVRIQNLSLHYGEQLALDNLNLDLPANQMLGLIGPDGVGKSSLMSLLTGARAIQQGKIEVLGGDMADASHRRAVCPRIAYMPQGLGKNLYLTLSVFENVDFFGRLFGQQQAEREQRIAELLKSTNLESFRDRPAGQLSGGMKQKLGLCCALIHDPDLLVLDEPTTGVDPIERDRFWELMIELSRHDQVTIFISTHFMNEAERCDRISLMHAGKVLASDTPAALVKNSGHATLEEAFIGYLQKASGSEEDAEASTEAAVVVSPQTQAAQAAAGFSLTRLYSYTLREALELRRDPIRASIALVGTLFLMFTFGYGITMDAEDLRFAVLDRDQTTLSNNYALDLGGSRYFLPRPPLADYAELDQRMRSGGVVSGKKR